MGARRRALLVASTGGHLEQITRLEKSFLPAFDEVAFATFDNPQSQSLLRGREVHTLDYIPPRGIRPSLRTIAPANRIIRAGDFSDVITTGAAIAVPFMLAARAASVRAHYIESAARSQGPSLTGRIVAGIPGVNLYAQYPTWGKSRWRYRGSVFNGFGVTSKPRFTDRGAQRVVVTLGTIQPFGFRRAVEAIQRVLADVASRDVEVLWQVGCTDITGLRITGVALVPSADLRSAIQEADLVFAHAGIGSCLQILDCKHAPVLLPRERRFGEHVDDHQKMIAHELDRRGLAVSRAPSQLLSMDAVEASSRIVTTGGISQSFRLEGIHKAAADGSQPASQGVSRMQRGMPNPPSVNDRSDSC